VITFQEAVDRNYQWFIVQKHPRGVTHDGFGRTRCCYRIGCNSCAIGCLIPASKYSPDLEGPDVSGLFEVHPRIRRLFSKPKSPFWTDLQSWHDDQYCSAPALRRICKEFKLTYPGDRRAA
jgi:hypothetical protein